MDSQDTILVEKICEIYDNISSLDSLKPSKDVNMLFTQLARTYMPPHPIEVTKLCNKTQEIRSKLIRLCGEAEGLLENNFSAILGSYENPLDHLKIFPYFSSYLKLSHLEFNILSNHYTHVPSQVAFVGSGPLPLTSIVLASHYLKTISFHNFDINPLANSNAQKLVSNDPDLSKRMNFYTTNILDVTDELRNFQVVFLSAFVGMNIEDKKRIIDHLTKHMAPGAILMLRSAHGARGFLYPIVDPCYLKGFEILSVFHPTDEVTNSVIIARKFPMPAEKRILQCSKCSNQQMHDFNRLKNGNAIEKQFDIEETTMSA